MSGKFVIKLCNLLQLGSVIALAGIGLKRNNDCYKAEMKLVDVEIELFKAEIDKIYKDVEIRKLKEELAELKRTKAEES